MRQFIAFMVAMMTVALPAASYAAANTTDSIMGTAGKNITAIGVFAVFILMTLAITYWAARKTTSASEYYAAGGSISGFQNGLAISGDFLSAALLLGITGLVYAIGYDAILYPLSPIAGLALVMFLMAGPFRNLGRYNMSDIASYRLSRRPIRVFSGTAGLVVVIFYLIAQMIGAGWVIQLLFGIPFDYAVLIIGALMVIYVGFGGMLATTWVQITKAVLMISTVMVMTAMVLFHFDFNLMNLFAAASDAHPKGDALLQPGLMFASDAVSSISLGMGLVFGFAGLPHVLMRLFTVPDAKEARRSVLHAAGWVTLVQLAVFLVIGFGARAMITGHTEFLGPDGQLVGGNNMVVLYLAKVLGGDILFGVMSAVAFATVLAVVAGLTMAGASAVAHDIYDTVIAKDGATEEQHVWVSRMATVGLGIIAVGLALVFKAQNVAFMSSLAFAVAASSNFPVLLLSLYWRGLTSRGAVVGGFIGLFTAVGLMILGPLVWVKVFGFEQAIFPYAYPALFSMPVSFVAIWLFSVLDRSARGAQERENFIIQNVKAETGIGPSRIE